MSQNPFTKEEQLESWLSRDRFYNQSKKTSLDNLYGQLPARPHAHTQFIQFIRMSFIKHTYAAIACILIISSGVGVTAAELFADQDYKPSQIIQQIFNPEDFQTNKQTDTNPYTALQPDAENDVASSIDCGLAIKFPSQFNGNQTQIQSGILRQQDLVGNALSITNEGNRVVIECYDQAEFNAVLDFDAPRTIKAEDVINATGIYRPEAYDRNPIETQKFKDDTGWFVNQADLGQVYRFVDRFEEAFDSFSNVRTSVLFYYQEKAYIAKYTNLDDALQILSQLEGFSTENIANEQERLRNSQNNFAQQIQVQFNSLAINEPNVEFETDKDVTEISQPANKPVTIDTNKPQSAKTGTITGQLSWPTDALGETQICTIEVTSKQELCEEYEFAFNEDGRRAYSIQRTPGSYYIKMNVKYDNNVPGNTDPIIETGYHTLYYKCVGNRNTVEGCNVEDQLKVTPVTVAEGDTIDAITTGYGGFDVEYIFL